MCKDVPTHQVTYRELDIRTGGHYVMEIHDSAKGEIYIGTGDYLEVREPEKLVFTWSWHKNTSDGTMVQLHQELQTQVTVEFFVRGASTEVLLTHEGFLSQAAVDEHDGGWTGCFIALDHFLQSERG
jgi:uncharacterized protein YndB with AHSA1/START domain